MSAYIQTLIKLIEIKQNTAPNQLDMCDLMLKDVDGDVGCVGFSCSKCPYNNNNNYTLVLRSLSREHTPDNPS